MGREECQAQKRTVKSCRKPSTCMPHGKTTNSVTAKVTELAYNMQTLSGTSAWVSTFTGSAMPPVIRYTILQGTTKKEKDAAN